MGVEYRREKARAGHAPLLRVTCLSGAKETRVLDAWPFALLGMATERLTRPMASLRCWGRVVGGCS